MTTESTVQLTGHSIVAGAPLAGTAGTVAGQDPATARALEPAYSLLDEKQVAQATAAAQEAFASFSALAPEPHARFLEQIAENIDTLGPDVVARARQEIGRASCRERVCHNV